MRTLLALVLLGLLSGCLPHRPSYYDYESYPSGGPLSARIVDVNGQIRVYTSRPAYVALFELVPGQGVGLLYPAYTAEGNYLPGGTSTVWIRQSRSYYSYFVNDGGYGPQVRYLYLVASETPLRVSHLVRSPGALRSMLGMNRFASASPYTLADDLNALVVPNLHLDNWTSDIYAISTPRSARRGDRRAAVDRWVQVRCPDGRVITGPWYYVQSGCAALARQEPPLVPKPPAETGDSVRVPTRRRPEPEERGTAGGEGMRTRTQPRVRAEPAPRSRPVAEEEPRTRPERTREASPRVESRPEREEASRVEPPSGRRAEPRTESRPEPSRAPRVESAPRSEPAPRAETPRSEPPRSEPTPALRPDPR